MNEIYNKLKNGLNNNERGYEWRVDQLQKLKILLTDNDQQLCEALWKDLKKSTFECQATEQGVVLGEIDDCLKHLKKWMRPQKVSTPLYNLPGWTHISYEPYGLALIIGAWNYPINLTLAPLVGAIAGGNGAIIKPSEISQNTAKLLSELLPRYLDPDLFAVIEGGAKETDQLLDFQFDTIFFTGSGPVGKLILQKAAVHLTPTTLELGGKSPAIVLEDADLEVTARRLTWGKFLNAGQTCVAPDYILCHKSIKSKLIDHLRATITSFYGTDAALSPDYCRIINPKNFDRLKNLSDGNRILFGGDFRKQDLYISPTLIEGKLDSALMAEEIFGPLLPIIEFENLNEAIQIINSKPKPLSLYLFTKMTDAIKNVEAKTSSGALVINDVVVHMPMPSLPFGGVGASGMGHYHGEYSFKTFTHAKGVLRKSYWFDVPLRYPPYTKNKARILNWLFR